MSADVRQELAIALRAALDLVVAELGTARSTRGLGRPELVAEFAAYGPTSDAADRLACLGASPATLRREVEVMAPAVVVVVADGPLARLRPRLAGRLADLAPADWVALGYRRERTWGLQGVGSCSFAVAERIARLANRPDLADRFRIAMLRTLVASPVGRRCALIGVREYRRSQ